MFKNKIYILKNFILPGESWPAFRDIIIPIQIVEWGIIIDDDLYFIVTEDEQMKLIYRSFNVNFTRFDNIRSIELDCNLTSSDITKRLQAVLKSSKNDTVHVIQTNLVNALISNPISDDLQKQIISDKLCSISHRKFIDDQLMKNNNPQCIIV